MIQKLFALLLGNKSDRDLKEIQPYVDLILAVEPSVQALDNDGLRAKTHEFRARLERAQSEDRSAIEDLRTRAELEEDADAKNVLFQQIDDLDKKAYEKAEAELAEILPEAFAVIRETAKRLSAGNFRVRATEMDRELAGRMDAVQIDGDHAVWHNTWTAAGATVEWNMVHYNVQMIGGTVLHLGRIAEMATGEGKTLVATLPVYLNALTGFGVHLVTVNDYLAKRDAEWMGPLYQFHGLTVDCIDKHQPNSDARRKAYAADITFGTNNEFGFDYLRDNMARFPEELVQRGHNFAIVDEVDSVLIDDARTPLIISGPTPNGDRHEFNELKPHVVDLFNAQKTIAQDALNNAKRLLTEGNNKEAGFQLLRAHRGLPKNKALIKFLSEDGNKTLLQKTENFYLQDHGREMKVVDEELYFTIEEKNNQVQLTDRGMERLADRTDPAFFVMPDISTSLAAIEKSNETTADKAEHKAQLLREYRIKSERVHTMSQLLKAYTLFEKDQEYVLMDSKVKIVDEQTGRIMEGRRYSDGLHQAIEAKENVTIEAATQTYATVTLQNYFRMYRKLAGMTGTAETEAGEFWEIYKLDVTVIPTNRPISRSDHDDLVYKTKREKYNAAIDEIVKLRDAGRPVLVGTTSVEISELLSRALKLRNIPHNVLNAKLHQREAEIVAEAGRAGAVTIATNMAGRGTDIKLAPEAKAAGGLAIVGTERHDSRRVDRQLRGRAGRQGDPGSSQFFVSLEDNLMRLFGSDRVAKLMDRMGLEEGEVIQHSMMTKSIERAQKKVEENNFGIRKRLLEYDDVMNAQREVIYKRRRHALNGERLQLDIANMMFDTCELISEQNKLAGDFKNFTYEIITYFGLEPGINEETWSKMSVGQSAQYLYQMVRERYTEKMERAAQSAFGVIEKVYNDPNSHFERISVPFTDGMKSLNVVTHLEKAYQTQGKQLVADFEKNINLALIDEAWKTHLRKMDELKQSVQLAVHEQKDPLLIYKFEAFELFKSMIDRVNKEIISFLFKAQLPEGPQAPSVREAQVIRPKEKLALSKEEVLNSDERAAQARNAGATASKQASVETVVRQAPKMGRNDKVMIKNMMNGEQKEMKYKQAEPLLKQGTWVLVNS